VVPPHPFVHDPQWAGSEVRSAQILPQAVRPDVQVWQLPPMHAAVETHWLAPLPEQLVRQALPPHRKGLQLLVSPAGHRPCPSQNAAAVLTPLLELQLAGVHITLDPGTEQVAAPLHVPWQTPVPAHEPCLGVPVRIPQVPAGVLAGAPPQYWQVPVHALVQQTPSTHIPVRHCVPVVHACPVFVLHVPVPSQVVAPVHALGSSAFVIATHVPFGPAQV
jgi:hypothetical protein